MRELQYELEQGCITHWLLARAPARPLVTPATADASAWRTAALRALAEQLHEALAAPNPSGDFAGEGTTGVWVYADATSDGWLDLAGEAQTGQQERAWLYAGLWLAQPQVTQLELRSWGPVDLWVNGRVILSSGYLSEEGQRAVLLDCPLRAGLNDFMLRIEQVAPAGGAYALGVSLCWQGGPAAGASVRLPALSPNVQTQQALMEVIAQAAPSGYLCVGDEALRVRWPEPVKLPVCLRLQKITGEIYAQRVTGPDEYSDVEVARGCEVPPGRYRLRLMPPEEQYYIEQMRIQRDHFVSVLPQNELARVDAPISERARDVLTYAIRYESGMFAQVAALALGGWPQLDRQALQKALDRRGQGDSDYLREFLGLLRILTSHGAQPGAPGELVARIRAAVTARLADVADESLQQGRTPLSAACQLLARERHHAQRQTSEESAQAVETARNRVVAWLVGRGRFGSAGWNTPDSVADEVLALAHLIDFAADKDVRELATVALDKLLFTLALNCRQGALGCPNLKARTEDLLDGRGAATTPISYLVWGEGCLHPHAAAAIALACSTYSVPTIVADIALAADAEMTGCERHRLDGVSDAGEAEELHRVTHRTPDYMLSSVLDYRAGERLPWGHVWQATLSPRAQVFTNHPGRISGHEAYGANFWRGNDAAPRVAQWQNLLVAVYHLPTDAPLDFTHAHFPTDVFDEHHIEGSFAFARVGAGYLALWAQRGLTLSARGPAAGRELRSVGARNIWVCQMGRAATDRSYEAFCARARAASPVVTEERVTFTATSGESVEFGWQGDFLVNGVNRPLRHARHYDSPYAQSEYGSDQMTVRTADWQMDLQFQP